MEAAKSGKSMASLLADFNASGKAQEQHFQVCFLASACSLWHVHPSFTHQVVHNKSNLQLCKCNARSHSLHLNKVVVIQLQLWPLPCKAQTCWH